MLTAIMLSHAWGVAISWLKRAALVLDMDYDCMSAMGCGKTYAAYAKEIRMNGYYAELYRLIDECKQIDSERGWYYDALLQTSKANERDLVDTVGALRKIVAKKAPLVVGVAEMERLRDDDDSD